MHNPAARLQGGNSTQAFPKIQIKPEKEKLSAVNKEWDARQLTLHKLPTSAPSMQPQELLWSRKKWASTDKERAVINY